MLISLDERHSLQDFLHGTMEQATKGTGLDTGKGLHL
jgi:hypothetical protein